MWKNFFLDKMVEGIYFREVINYYKLREIVVICGNWGDKMDNGEVLFLYKLFIIFFWYREERFIYNLKV